MEIAISFLVQRQHHNSSAIPPLSIGKELTANQRILDTFEIILDNTGEITRAANPNWNKWLENVVSVFALTLKDEPQSTLNVLIAKTSKSIKETLALLTSQDRNTFCRQLGNAIFNYFSEVNEHDLEKVIQLTENLGIEDAKKYLLFQKFSK